MAAKMLMDIPGKNGEHVKKKKKSWPIQSPQRWRQIRKPLKLDENNSLWKLETWSRSAHMSYRTR
jgi:AraC-like DNA-binding protein